MTFLLHAFTMMTRSLAIAQAAERALPVSIPMMPSATSSVKLMPLAKPPYRPMAPTTAC